MVTKKSTKKTTSMPTKHVSKQFCGHIDCKDTGGMFYFLGFVGALVYYIATATGFWMGVLGVLKALIWPAMLVFKLLAM